MFVHVYELPQTYRRKSVKLLALVILCVLNQMEVDGSGQRMYKIGKKNWETGINISRIIEIIPSAEIVMSAVERMDKLLKQKCISENKMTFPNP